MTYDDIKTSLSLAYPVNKVAVGVDYWINILTEKCINIFKYENLPQNLPAEQIEMRLILTGYCGVFNHKTYGIVTSYGGLSDLDLYYKPRKFIYAQPRLGAETLTINKECVIMYNTLTDMYAQTGLRQLIKRYARMLADIESSINIFVVNTRAINSVVTDNQVIAKSVDEFFTKIQNGDFSTINKNTILEGVKKLDLSQHNQNTLTELMTCRDNTLKSFLQEIGIKSSTEKRERLITDEVNANNQLLIINLQDMLTERKKGIEQINNMFGLNITVNITPEYDINTYSEEGENNDAE